MSHKPEELHLVCDVVAETLKRLPDIVRNRRAERGLSYPSAARQIGIPVTTLYRFESRDGNPMMSTVLALLRWLTRRPKAAHGQHESPGQPYRSGRDSADRSNDDDGGRTEAPRE